MDPPTPPLDDATQSNDGLATEKQKRSRKRKTASDVISDHAFQVAAHLHSAEVNTLPDHAITSPLLATPDDSPPPALSTSEAPTASTTPVIAVSGCGGQLKAAREALGLSIHEVCSQLRLGVHQIQAIEQDDFAKLPQSSIVRGFIRNYARLLKIDAQPILQAYQRLTPDMTPANISVKASAHSAVINAADPPMQVKSVVAGVLLLCAVAVLAYFYIHHVQPVATLENPAPLSAEPAPDSVPAALPALANETAANTPATEPLAAPADAVSASTPQTDTNPNPAPLSDSSATNNNAVASANSVTTNSATSAATTGTSMPASTSIPNAAPPVTTGVSTTVASTTNPPTTSSTKPPLATTASTPTPASNTVATTTTLKALDPVKTELRFAVTEESWVRIEDAQGKKVLSEVLSPGASKQITVEKPLSIIVGHANATQLFIDNQPYDLTQATRGRVARVQLK